MTRHLCRPFAVLVLALVVLLGCTASSDDPPASSLTRAQAIQSIVQQLIEPAGLDESDVAIYGTDSPLVAGDRVKPVLALDGTTAVPTSIERDTWFFWVDLQPFARFVHPTWFVFVEVEGGAVRREEQRWYAVVNDVELPPSDDAQAASRVWGNPVHPDAADGGVLTSSRTEPVPGGMSVRNGSPLTNCDGYVALIVNTWPNSRHTTADQAAMMAFFSSHGYTIDPVGAHPAGNAASRETIMSRLAFYAQDRPLPYCQFVLYYTGHGVSQSLVMGNDQYGSIQISVGELAEAWSKIDACETTLLLDACESGSFTTHFGTYLKELHHDTCKQVTILSAAKDGETAWTDLLGGGSFTNALLSLLEPVPAGQPVPFRASGATYLPPSLGWSYTQTPVYGQVVPDPGCPCRCCPETQTSYCDPTEPRTADAYAFGNNLGTADLACAMLVTQVDTDATLHSSESVPPKAGAGDHTETLRYGAGRLTLSAGALDAAFNNSLYPCGSGALGMTLCPAAPVSLPPGDYVVALNVMHGALPLDDTANRYQYAFVFDADADPDNNYVASPTYPNDFFHGTDRWYEAVYSPSAGWQLKVTSASPSGTTAASSNARLVLQGNVVGLVVPADEFTASHPDYRATAFRHTGDYGMTPPYDWSGDVEPPVGLGLASMAP